MEKSIQNNIRLALASYGVVFRANVGTFLAQDGRYIATGLPKGFSDLFGFRFSDGKAFFIEVKTNKGRASKQQLHFIDTMREKGAIAGICRSVDEAIRMVENG